MSLDVDLKKLDKGFGEVFKMGINFAEYKLTDIINEYKEIIKDTGYIEEFDFISEDIRTEGGVFYDEKVSKIREFYRENFGDEKVEEIEKKYFVELNKMMDSKINELEKYTKSLEVTQ